MEGIVTKLAASITHALASMILHIVETIHRTCAESGEDIQNLRITKNLEKAFTNILWNVLYANRKKDFINECIEKYKSEFSSYPGVKNCRGKASRVASGVSFVLFDSVMLFNIVVYIFI